MTVDPRERLHIGVVAWAALPAILSERPGRGTPASPADGLPCFGGMETAMWRLCRSLARRPEIDVTAFVTAPSSRGPDGPWPERVDNVGLSIHVDRFGELRRQVSRHIDVEARRIKSFSAALFWQLPLLAVTRPFRDRDPEPGRPDPRLVGATSMKPGARPVDRWITFGVNANSSRVIATAKAAGVPVLTSVQSNAGTDPRIATADFVNSQGEHSAVQRDVIARSDVIVCQTTRQQDELASAFDRRAVRIPNAIDPEFWRPDGQTPRSDRVLWIGRYDSFHKRPLMMIEVARRLPEVSFRMIINPFDAEVRRRVHRDLPPNVEVVDRVDFHAMPAEFHRARLFVSTGNPHHEGFPNVLLQSAAARTPIVSVADYDDFLLRSGAGVVVGDDVHALTLGLRNRTRPNTTDWARVDRYLADRHSPDAVAGQHLDALATSAAVNLGPDEG